MQTTLNLHLLGAQHSAQLPTSEMCIMRLHVNIVVLRCVHAHLCRDKYSTHLTSYLALLPFHSAGLDELPDQLLQVAQHLRVGACPGGQLLLPAARLQAGPCGMHDDLGRIICMRPPDPLRLIRVLHACVPAYAPSMPLISAGRRVHTQH